MLHCIFGQIDENDGEMTKMLHEHQKLAQRWASSVMETDGFRRTKKQVRNERNSDRSSPEWMARV